MLETKSIPGLTTIHVYTKTTREKRSLLLGVLNPSHANNNEMEQPDHVWKAFKAYSHEIQTAYSGKLQGAELE